MVWVYKRRLLARYFELRLHTFQLGYRNRDAGVDRVPDLGGDRSRGACELRERGGWVIDVTVRVLQGIEGGTLVSGQWDAVLYA
jgi:hypothetical protein